MDESGIEELLLKVLDRTGHKDDAAQRVFASLVRSTLEYRDRTLESKGVVVTVEDVRACLDWLVPILASGNMPDMDNEIRQGLLKAWLAELTKRENGCEY